MAKAQFVVELGGTATAHPVKVRRFAENPGKSNKTGAETELKHEEHIAEAEAKCDFAIGEVTHDIAGAPFSGRGRHF